MPKKIWSLILISSPYSATCFRTFSLPSHFQGTCCISLPSSEHLLHFSRVICQPVDFIMARSLISQPVAYLYFALTYIYAGPFCARLFMERIKNFRFILFYLLCVCVFYLLRCFGISSLIKAFAETLDSCRFLIYTC